MNQGMDLQTLATTVVEHASGKEDFILPPSALRFNLNPSNQILLGLGDREFDLTSHAENQIEDFLGISRKYAQLLLDKDPWLLSTNLNQRSMKSEGRRMVRTLTGTARSFLSDGYQRIDNEMVFDGMFPVLTRLGAKIEACNVSDDYMHLQAIFHSIEGEIRVGDIVRFGVSIRNSEIGKGALSISPLLYRLACTNGMVVADHAKRRAHIGGSYLDSVDASWVALSSETQQLKTRAIIAEMGEYLEALGTEDRFQKVLGALREKADDALPAEPTLVVESLAARYSLNKPESESALLALAAGQDYTRWGLANSVTVLANTAANYDRAVELETLGGLIMQMPKAEYAALARLPKKSEILDAELVNA